MLAFIVVIVVTVFFSFYILLVRSGNVQSERLPPQARGRGGGKRVEGSAGKSPEGIRHRLVPRPILKTIHGDLQIEHERVVIY